MPIEFKCSACNKPLRVPDEVAGKIAKCPHCDAQMQVPLASQPAVDPTGHAPTPPNRPAGGATQNPFAGPATPTPSAPLAPGSTITIRRMDVASCAIMLGILYGIGGLIGGVIFAIFALIGGLAGGGPGAMQAAGGGLFLAILLPVGYGVAGLVGGAIAALLYNLAAKFVGGVKLEI